ncbi:pH-response regulator protein palI/prr-5-like [Lotus japonicus]|uniref:pH-response regulator protein palI/prr-5-like n=1 Tax=Lotus japonicus TaxID=34305 RepID=UPI00258571AF|nr:pH-response regulator protein palI/prr-5-like [Lotus japonicus]
MIITHDARLERSRKRSLSDSTASALLAHTHAFASVPAPISPQISQTPPPSVDLTPSQANYAAEFRGGRDYRNDQQRPNYRDSGDNRDTYHDQNDSRGPGGGRGGYPAGGRGGGRDRGRGRNLQCQKWGHDASVCYHRAVGGGSVQNGTFTNMPSPAPFGAFPPMPLGSATFGSSSPSFYASGPAPWNYFGSSAGPYNGAYPPGSQFPAFTSGSQYSAPGAVFGPASSSWNSPRPSPPSYPGLLGSQPRSPAHAMLAGPLHHASSSASQRPDKPTLWYPDSGATHHVTNAAGNFSDTSSFTGTEQILMGNGQGNI